MTAINAAWELIGDPKKRAAFDRERLVQAAMSRSRGAGAGATSGGATSGGAAAGGGAADTSGRGPSGGQAGGGGGATGSSGNASGTPPPRPPEDVSRDWTSGRSTVGGGYDPSMRTADGDGAAGPPPGNPSGSVLNFGRYSGWSLGEIARGDLEYIEWLDRTPIGRPYREEIDGILRRTGRRRSAEIDPKDRRGLFRRR
jgi:curved DNA-binding protein CbpA